MPSRPGRAALAALALAAAAGGAARAQPSAERVYSDACRTPESDDVAGHQVALAGDPRAPRVAFSWSDGQMQGPVAARDVRYSPRDGRLRFAADTPSGEAVFTGRLTRTALVGQIKDGWEAKPVVVRLARREPASAALRPCPPPPGRRG
jgi:hypothetical protein